MAAAQGPVEARFKSNVSNVLNIILAIVQENKEKLKELDSNWIVLAINVMEDQNPEYAIEIFISYSEKYWKNIKAREKAFFLTSADNIFGQLPITNLSPFKLIFERKIIIDNDLTKLWDYLNQMVRQAIMYLRHRMRNAKEVIIRKDTKDERIFTMQQVEEMVKYHEVGVPR